MASNKTLIKLAQSAVSLIRPGHLVLPLSGSPSSGKTSVRKYLEELEIATITEFPAEIIHEHEQGLHDLHPAKDMYPFNEEVFRRQLKAERKARRNKVLYPDRSLYDPEAYFRKLGLPMPDYLEALPPGLYDKVFIFENLPWVKDGIRHEGAQFAEEIKDFFPRTYLEHGVDVIHVPVFTCTEDDLSQQQLEELAVEKQKEPYAQKLKQMLINKSIETRALYIIGKTKEHHPDAELPIAV